MAQNQNRISRFWKELKRRRVIHVITVYASAVFVIIELVGNLTEPLNLPSQLSTIVIIALAVCFPPAIILSWLYDLTSGTFERTRPMEESQEEEEAKVPNAWRIATYVSFLVIAGLVVFNIVSRGDIIKPEMIQSLAILPFDNFTGDQKLDYVAAGMHSSLIGDMGKLGALRVIGKTSSSIFKNTDNSAPEIARELNVQAVVEPTVMCYGDSVCVQIRVITMYPEEKQLFVGEYTADKSQVLNLYSKITKQIADELMIELSPGEKRVLSKSRTIDREAFDAYLRSQQHWGDLSKESLQKALDYLNSAIKKEPNWAPLYSGLAQVWLGIQQMGFELPSVSMPEIYKNLNKALELDPNLSEAHYLTALIAHVGEWDWQKSEIEYLKALAINPNDAQSRALYAQLLCVLQRTDEGITQGRLALNLDPYNPYVKCWYGAILLCVGECKTALELMETITGTDPGNYLANNVILSAAFQCKEYDKVIKAERYNLPVFGVKEDDIKEIERIFNEQGFIRAYEKIMIQLEQIAENNPISPIDMAVRYMMANQADKAMDWLEKGFELHDPAMPYIATEMFNFGPLFNNPRFIDIVKKTNLTLPRTN
jgi:TolB-like protein